MDLSKFIEVIKDFFLDILGYLIPGIFFILVCNFCLLCEYQDIFVFSESSYDVSIIIVFSYVVGHILYGAAIWRDELKIRIMNSSSFSKKSKDMANGLIPPPPPSSEHISHRFDTYTSPSTQTPKKSISQQFADKYTSISQHFKNKYSLKEGFINNSFFEKMLLENLTSSTLKKGVFQE